jgi:hypothetical protein
MTVIHKRDVRLYVNAGMAFPACKANAKLLDLDAARLRMAGAGETVTCKRCLRLIARKA